MSENDDKKQAVSRMVHFLVGLLLVAYSNNLGLKRGLRINDQALKEVLMGNEAKTISKLEILKKAIDDDAYGCDWFFYGEVEGKTPYEFLESIINGAD